MPDLRDSSSLGSQRSRGGWVLETGSARRPSSTTFSKVMPYYGSEYVLIKPAGAGRRLACRIGPLQKGGLPDLMFPADHS